MSKVFRPFGNSKTARIIEDPGGAIIHKVATGSTDRGANTAANNLMPWAPNHETLNQATPQSEPYNPVNDYQPNAPYGDRPAMRLGWTNGGYNYANSPWNGQAPTPANPMSFAPPQQPQLQPGGAPGSMPAAGAQQPQQPPPTSIVAGRKLRGTLS